MNKDSPVQGLAPLDINPSLINQIYDHLVEAIATDRLQPGARLNQRALAETFKVSRQPVSHALHRLKSAGLARDSGSKGLVVAPIDPKRLIDLYDVRAAIEGLVAERAASRIADGQVETDDVDRLRDLLQFAQTMTKATSVAACIEADVRFHLCVSQICGSEVMMETIDPLWPHFRRSMGRVLMDHDHRQISWQGHERVVKALIAGDAGLARHAIQSHIEEAKLFVLDKISRAVVRAG